eukprot:GFUD01022379.1.p1 GENE.GFUD01022379.1~~GFUD01022379.1.p1  ORF type:complete len:495 (+),score=82.82 GFUD01022379.1:9-1493(+)
MHVMWCLTILFIGKVFSSGDDNFCFEEGVTWNHDDQIDIEVNIPTASECQNECKADGPCVAFTWNMLSHPHFPKVCSLFNSTDRAISCLSCLSGPPSCLCSQEFACNIVGDNIIDIVQSVSSEEECQVSCKNTENCKIYTWFNEDAEVWKSTCFLFMYCDDTDITCTGCFSGPPTCSSSTTPPTTSTLTSTSTTVTTPLPKPQLGLLISGGVDDHETILSSVEVFIPSSNVSCSLPSLPSSRDDHTMDGPYVCGGNGGGAASDCLQFSSGTWTSLSTTVHHRYYHCSWWTQGGQGQLVLIGGNYINGANTTEVVPVQGGEEGLSFSLKNKIEHACAITDRDTDTVIITGGQYTKSQVSRYNMEGFVSKLPDLLTGRGNHACGSFKRTDGTLVLLVAGGWDGSNRLQSTETLDIGLHGTWQLVSPLPWAVLGARAVTLDNNLFITGGYSTVSKADILQFDEAENSWKHAGMMLQARADHAVTEIDLEGEMMDYCT